MLLQNFLENSADRLPNKIALICGNNSLAYREIDEKANSLALFLRDGGVQRQDRVAIFLDNSVESVISIFGILKSNAIFLMLSPTLKARKLAYILNDCQVKALITQASKSAIVFEALSQAPTVEMVLWTGSVNQIPKGLSKNSQSLAFSEGLSRAFSQLSPHENQDSAMSYRLSAMSYSPSANIDLDLATIIYTSGSTGNPKGVMLTHLNMVSAATSITTYLENTEDDIILSCLPLSFDYGLYQVLMAFKFGGTVALERSFTFPYQIIQKLVEVKATGFPLVPTILAILFGLKGLDKYDFSSLRYITNTAAALPPTHIAKLRKMFPKVRLFSMYGLTECKRVSYLPPDEIDRRPTSIGRGMPNEEVWIVDDQGNPVGSDVVGELVVRGSNVMRGYWGLPEETARALRPGKYPGEVVLYSGDLFQKDEEGYLYFVGRKDDLIKSRGERVSPGEIEHCLCILEEVLEAAVFGVPDEILGQAIVAYISIQDGYRLDDQRVMKHCKENLEEFMIPKYIRRINPLPKTPNGKIDKLALKKLELKR